MARYADKLALVTGASRGLGRAVATVLAREGAHVILAARREGSLEDVDDDIRAAGGSATLVKLGLTAGEKIDALGPTVYERWGKLDILVANAGPGKGIRSDNSGGKPNTRATSRTPSFRSVFSGSNT